MRGYHYGRGIELQLPDGARLALRFLSVIPRRVAPLTHLLRSGRVGGPHAGTDRRTSMSFVFLSPQSQAGADGFGEGNFSKWLFRAQIPFCQTIPS
jgi:hypothetical protein